MKIKILSALLCLIIPACQTDSAGHKSLTPAAQAELQQLGAVAAQIIANAVVIGAQSAANQYLSTGKLDTKQLASDEIYGLAANAQGYVGQIVPRQTLVDAAANPQVAKAVAASLPDQISVTQATVNALDAQAAQLTQKK